MLAPLLMLKCATALGALDPTLDPSRLEDDAEAAAIAIEPSDVQYISARYQDTVIRGRPWVPNKRVATIGKGTRLVVRGEVESRDKEGCKGKTWYAVWPMGFVCSNHFTEAKKPPEVGAALPLSPGKRLPHAYALVRADGTPAYGSEDDVRLGVEKRSLTKGMSLVVTGATEIAGVRYVTTKNGLIVAKSEVGWMGQGSQWHGVRIEGVDEPGPLFGWVRSKTAKVWDAPASENDPVGTIVRRQRVPIFESQGAYRRIGPGQWVDEGDLNEVSIVAPPEGVITDFRRGETGNDQWVDVDVGEQVLVTYRGAEPQYATLVSSGRGSPTPLGNYPVWAKVASMDMANQDYEDNPYLVQGVPWVVLFQGHIALHGAYWHDRFGNRKSHGCVNLAPLDARHVFEWIGPTLPVGWTGFLPDDLHKSPVVHVRDSSKEPGLQFTQQRPWGPPDRTAERKKSEAAAKRRELAAASASPDVGAGEFLPPPSGGTRIESKPAPL
ncbi:MAG: L,D-transpeptidase [Nannocystaceae bacterium]|nr:L,D-transpeptidase [bacterium]